MAYVWRDLRAVECGCGKMHEICYQPNQGAVGGGHVYLCGVTVRAVLPHERTRTVTLGLEPVEDK